MSNKSNGKQPYFVRIENEEIRLAVNRRIVAGMLGAIVIAVLALAVSKVFDLGDSNKINDITTALSELTAVVSMAVEDLAELDREDGYLDTRILGLESGHADLSDAYSGIQNDIRFLGQRIDSMNNQADLYARLEALETAAAEQASVEASSLEVAEVDLSQPGPPATTPCVVEERVVRQNYYSLENFPIPNGEFVEVIRACEDDTLVLRWDEEIAEGTFSHYVAMYPPIDYKYYAYRSTGVSEVFEGASGHLELVDIYDDTGVLVEDGDGVIDVVYIYQAPSWSPEERAMIDFGNEFYQDAVEESFIYVSYASDCHPQEYRVNGVKVEPGPYGGTYLIPAEGGSFEAWGSISEHCQHDEPPTAPRWSVEVVPGDALFGTERIFKESLENMDPWQFCRMLRYMRPVWQTYQKDWNIPEECGNIYSRTDQTGNAVLSRIGFWSLPAFSSTVSPKDWVPYVLYGHAANADLESLDIPKIDYWYDTNEINLDDNDPETSGGSARSWDHELQPQLDENGNVIFLGGSPHHEGERLVLSSHLYEVGDILMFVDADARDSSYWFDWREDSVLFRVVYDAEGNLQLQSAAWAPEVTN